MNDEDEEGPGVLRAISSLMTADNPVMTTLDAIGTPLS
jgi:hypothetical protein